MPPAEPIAFAHLLLQHLMNWGLQHVFIVPGLQIDPLNRALAAQEGLQAVLAQHEAGAGYMADGYARARGGAGAVFTIGGPGCANLMGAAITARADASPVLYVTGNIPRAAQGRGEFQDGGPTAANDAGLAWAALGHSLLPQQTEQLAPALAEAGERLAAGQPVHLGLACDLQAAVVAPAPLPVAAKPAAPALDAGRDETLAQWLGAERVLLFADAQALPWAETVAALAARQGLPLATSLAARGLLDEAHALSAGHLGFMPHPRAEALLAPASPWRADRVLHIGSEARWSQALGQRHGRVLAVSPQALAAWLSSGPAAPGAELTRRRAAWIEGLRAVQRPAPLPMPAGRLDHAQALAQVSACWPADTAWVVDAGQVRRIAAARLPCRRPRTLFMAEGMAPMGWSLGAAVGVALARPGRPVVALLGDGAMRMHGIEIASAARYRLPILYLLFDNQAYGSVLQRMATPEEQAQAVLPAVDWAAFARAFGLPCWTAHDAAGLRRALAEAAQEGGPRLLVLRVPAVDPEAMAQPTGIDWQLPADLGVET